VRRRRKSERAIWKVPRNETAENISNLVNVNEPNLHIVT
jgi:hypothetical protein